MSEYLTNWQLQCVKNIQYEIVQCLDVFALDNDCLIKRGACNIQRALVVIDSMLFSNYANKIEEYFIARNIEVKIIVLTAGEFNKSLNNYIKLIKELDLFVLKRKNEPIIAVGGGVLTDLVGFVASTYRRGVPYIKIPTTLMGYVDAAIGIKTGINFDGSKNRIGSFYESQRVILDKTFLLTQEMRHVLNGVAEIVKVAVISDASLFALLGQHGNYSIVNKFQNSTAELILNSAINGMIEELAPNLFEDNLERAMDFGHTFSLALEMKYVNLLHGEAVIIDIILSTFLAYNRKFLTKIELDSILNLIIKLGLLACADLMLRDRLDINNMQMLLWNSVLERVAHRDGQKIPLPCGIGKVVFINDLVPSELVIAFKMFNNLVDEYMCLDALA